MFIINLSFMFITIIMKWIYVICIIITGFKDCIFIVNLRHYKQVIYLGTNTTSFHNQMLQYVTALLVIGSHQKKELYLFTSSKHYPPNLDCFLEREKNSSRLF